MTDSSTSHLPTVLTVAGLAQALGVGRRHAYKLVADGTIRSVRVGRAIRIPRSALVEFLDGPSEGRDSGSPA